MDPIKTLVFWGEDRLLFKTRLMWIKLPKRSEHKTTRLNMCYHSVSWIKLKWLVYNYPQIAKRVNLVFFLFFFQRATKSDPNHFQHNFKTRHPNSPESHLGWETQQPNTDPLNTEVFLMPSFLYWLQKFIVEISAPDELSVTGYQGPAPDGESRKKPYPS